MFSDGKYYIGELLNNQLHGKEYYIIKMVKLNMMAILLKVKEKVKENIFMKMANIILENGWIIIWMVKE